MAGLAESALIDPADDAVPLFQFWRPTKDWIGANLFRLLDAGIGASVMREGDPERGAVMIIFADDAGGAQVFGHVRTPNGHSVWMPVHVAPRLLRSECEMIARRALASDPDLWLLLINRDQFFHGGDVRKPFRPPAGWKVSIPDAIAIRASSILNQDPTTRTPPSLRRSR